MSPLKIEVSHIGDMSTESLALRAGRTKRSAVWNWKPLSKVVEEINQSKTWAAVLKITDRPAVFLCKQTNAGVPMPYECVVSDVGLIGLLEPALPSVAATPSGSLAHQVREYLQAFIGRDSRSFALGSSPLRQEPPRARPRSRRVINGMAGYAGAERGLAIRSGDRLPETAVSVRDVAEPKRQQQGR